MRLRWVLLGLIVLAFVLITAVVIDRQPQRGEYCTVDVGDTHAQFDLEQGRWAALIAAHARQRGMPARAASIALATAFQESKMRNIDYGDRDSVGLFQQRPSQGWGSQKEIMNPHFAIDQFYNALEDVQGYQSMDITKAAQRVQRSGHPEAYSKHETHARALASALTGYSPASFSCQFEPGTSGNARRVADNIDKAFGTQTRLDGASRIRYDIHGEDSRSRGWAVAQYTVANAHHLHVRRIAFDGHVWSAGESPEGWQKNSDGPSDSVVINVN